MHEGARQLPAHHLTIRLPWHDNGWRGTFCNNPCGNTSCTVLPRIASGRDDALETEMAGQSLEGLPENQLPPCVDEHVSIMAPFALHKRKSHPYAQGAQVTHGHFDATPYSIQPYSAAAVPFRWMLREQVEGNEKKGISGKAEHFKFDYEAAREPDLTLNKGWDKDSKTWVQEGTNQRVILDTFFSAAHPDKSLVFFYAKRTPLVDDSRRVIVGVGRVKSVGQETEYRYVGGSRPDGQMSGYLWERNIEHSIRPNGRDGFLLPYQELIELAEADESLDLSTCAALAPEEYHAEYSYGSELLPQDGAIASLLELERAIKSMRELFEAPWDDYLQWIDRELNRIWQVRGAFPGLGAALHAFGLPHGNLLAWYVAGNEDEPIDPWPVLGDLLNNPDSLPAYLRAGIGKTQQQKWQRLPVARRKLLKLIARLSLSNEQATRWYQQTERAEARIDLSDDDILANPYLVYENDRFQLEPVAFAVVDRGLFPPENLRKAFPVEEPSLVHEAIDERRVRAVMMRTLEEAADEGHTFLPETWLISRVRARAMRPSCPLDSDVLTIVDDALSEHLAKVDLDGAENAYQLCRFTDTSTLIRKSIRKRSKGQRNSGENNWRDLVDEAINEDSGDEPLSPDDETARHEKAIGLEEIYRSRVSVLIGAAGTGKTTLIKALRQIDSVAEGGMLLLAPTGKARVRLEQASGMHGKGMTVAQFLLGHQRYNGNTGRYFINPDAPRSSAHKTVVVDECSMLTEEQLAALLDAVKGVERLILVGDPRQLPPIGAGRPYVDIVKYLTPENIDSVHPRVGAGYVELTVSMRQRAEGKPRLDVLFANAFAGRLQDAGADEVWHTVSAGQSEHIKLIPWNQSEQLQNLILEEMASELGLESTKDEVGFEQSIGGVASEYNGKTNVFFNNQYKDRPGAGKSAEYWQILSPIRQSDAGVLALNRLIQHRFRKRFLDLAANPNYQRKIPAPAGPEGVIYGDKVINVVNSSRRNTFPERERPYVANGDIGIVVGHRRTKKRNYKPTQIEVELASQPGFTYKYYPSEFDGQESTPPLELAYALTVHKSQGSEFNQTFLVVPKPCRLLSREMLYTALTRHQGRVTILHQGDFRDLQQYAHDGASEVARRLTNLFAPSKPVEVLVKNQSMFLDENLVYRTERGELVRSKSEWIIADKLHRAGVDYQYEQPLMLDGVERFPDFTIVDDDAGTTWYWEHNGMLSNEAYRKRWERKLAAYRQEGIKPLSEAGGKNGTLLVTEEKEGIGLDADKIAANINAILED